MSSDLLSAGRATYNKELETWISKEKAAVELINAVGHLLYDDSVELVLFRNHLVDSNVSEVLNLHKYAAEVVQKPIDRKRVSGRRNKRWIFLTDLRNGLTIEGNTIG